MPRPGRHRPALPSSPPSPPHMPQPMKHPARCVATTLRGAPCKAFPVAGSRFCLSHDAALASKISAARKLGGQRRRRRASPAPGSVRLRTAEDALALLERAACDADRSDNSAARSRLHVSIAALAVRIIDSTTLAARIEALERQGEARAARGRGRA